ncbi:hypothetical protein BGZ63DRAFT_406098 [Mariannaea sp. PMI_226]|nr:hypothetical protein BGZ63DRAFT_406098 [Mariannaea sp. PMI_226]
MSQTINVPDTDSQKASVMTYMLYQPTHPMPAQGGSCESGEDFFKHEPSHGRLNALPSPPYEVWPSMATPAIPSTIHDDSINAIYGQQRNSFMLSDNCFGYAPGYPMLMEEGLTGYPHNPTPYPPLRSSTSPYPDPSSSGLKRGLTSVHITSSGYIQNDEGMLNSNSNDEHHDHDYDAPSHYSPNKSATDQSTNDSTIQCTDRSSTTSSQAETPPRYQLSKTTVRGGDQGSRQCSQPKGPKAKTSAQSRSREQGVSGVTERVRQQNRVAANKFRAKKNKSIQSLQVQEETLRKEHERLKSEVSKLRYDVTELKSCLLLHSQCDCTLIQDYISNEASNLVKRE